MSANLTASGESVYTVSAPIDARADNSVYNTVEAILAQANPKAVLDIGASDGVVNYNQRLTPTDAIIGLDIARSAAHANEWELPVQADAVSLPFKDDAFTHVLALDIIEHLTPTEAVQSMQEIQRVGAPDHQLIVSMPIISPTRLMTWIEGRRALLARQRPETGLFDRTHRILSGPLFHRLLFETAGYDINAAYDTVAHTKGSRHVSGPDVLPAVTTEATGPGRQARLARFYSKHQDNPLVRETLGHIMGYQRVYVLTPHRKAQS